MEQVYDYIVSMGGVWCFTSESMRKVEKKLKLEKGTVQRILKTFEIRELVKIIHDIENRQFICEMI